MHYLSVTLHYKCFDRYFMAVRLTVHTASYKKGDVILLLIFDSCCVSDSHIKNSRSFTIPDRMLKLSLILHTRT